jgi:hypothetical protein
MSYVIDLDIRNKIILRPACVQLCPELGGLSDDEIIFIALSYDYKSPLRRYNQQDRIRRAMIQAFGDNVPKILEAIEHNDINHRIIVAIEAYKSLQYDEKEELKNTYKEKIVQLQGQIPSLDGRNLENALKSIDMLTNRIKSIENEIYEDAIKEGQLKGSQELSHLEVLQKNKKNYDLVRNRKSQKV